MTGLAKGDLKAFFSFQTIPRAEKRWVAGNTLPAGYVLN
jgi:hypothetical protein